MRNDSGALAFSQLIHLAQLCQLCHAFTNSTQFIKTYRTDHDDIEDDLEKMTPEQLLLVLVTRSCLTCLPAVWTHLSSCPYTGRGFNNATG